ncbi:MAG: V-type ATP synthase subunit F [Candidatus Anstonellales archaeon]
MTQKIVVYGHGPVVLGFRLMGIEGEVVEQVKDVEKKIEDAIANENIGIVLVEQSLFNRVDWRLKKKIENIASPVILPVAGTGAEEREEETLDMLIKRALGFELKKK